jgi:hypothetical protein
MYWHFPHYTGYTGPMTYMIDENDWKLIRYWNAGSGDYALYHLADDPYERTDLSAKYPKRVKTMAARLDTHLAETEAELPRPRLGYDPGKPTRFDKKAITTLAEKFRRTQERQWNEMNPQANQ